jgi:putative nitroimidazole resistance protein
MRRKDREITNINEIHNIIHKARILHLGMFDGEYPYIVPLHYGYSFNEDKLIFYMHGAKSGKKYELININPSVFIEIETDIALVSGGDIACKYGSAYASIMARGKASIVEAVDEKIAGLNLLMQHQTGKTFNINNQMASSVNVIKVEAFDITAKSRPLI